MNEQSGRSLIEVIGAIAIAGLMTASAIGMYTMIKNNQERNFANVTLEQIARDVKTLMEMQGTYEGVSVNYLIKQGALQSDKSPIGGQNWSVISSADGQSFSINLVDLTADDCNYLTAHVPQWANAILVNGFEAGVTENCFETATNQVSFIVE